MAKRIAVVPHSCGGEQPFNYYATDGGDKIGHALRAYSIPSQLIQFWEELPGTGGRLWCDVETGTVYSIEPADPSDGSD